MTRRAPRAGLTLIERPDGVEASLWRRFRFEHQERCRETLFNRYVAKARAIAFREFRRRPPYGLDRSDFEQLAFGGLLEAIDRFDPLRGAPFDAFARHRIRGAIADGVAQSSERGAQYTHRMRVESERLRSLQPGALGESGDHVGELLDLASALAIGIIADNARMLTNDVASERPDLAAYESLSWRETQLRVLAEIDQLPPAEKSVMKYHYLEGVPFVQIARLLDVTKGRISQLHRAAVLKVRERMRHFE